MYASCPRCDHVLVALQVEVLGNSSPPEGKLSLAGVQVDLRSSADPFLLLKYRTKGSLTFGRTGGQLRKLGGELLGVGLLLLLPCCVFCVRWMGHRYTVVPDEAKYYSEDLLATDDDL